MPRSSIKWPSSSLLSSLPLLDRMTSGRPILMNSYVDGINDPCRFTRFYHEHIHCTNIHTLKRALATVAAYILFMVEIAYTHFVK